MKSTNAIGIAKSYLLENKERINSSQNADEFDYKEARNFLLKALFNSKKLDIDEFTIKEKMLNSLRIMFSKLFNLKPNQIKFTLREMSSTAAAGIEELRGDGIFRINIDEEAFIKYSNLEFCVTICHEFGHLKQMLDDIEGKNVFDIISCDFESLAKENWWQKKGRKFKYESNNNEYQANVYACKTVLSCIKYFEQKCGKTEESENAKQILIETLDLLKKEKSKNEKLLRLWEVANKIGRVEDKTYCTYQSPSYGLSQYALEGASYSHLSDKQISPEKARNMLKRIGNVDLPSNISSGKKDDIIEMWSDYIRVITAEAFNVSPDEIGFILVDVEDDGFVNLRQVDKKNPLYGYYILNFETVDKLSLNDLFKELMAKVNETIKTAHGTEIEQ